jgi:hypothetical protein
MIDAIALLKKLQTVNPDAEMSVSVREVDKLMVAWHWRAGGELLGLAELFDDHIISDQAWLDKAVEHLHQKALDLTQAVLSDSLR